MASMQPSTIWVPLGPSKNFQSRVSEQHGRHPGPQP
jgi:hypothetical protein